MTSLPVWPFVLGCKGENSVKTLLLLPHLTTEQMTQHWVRPDFYKHVLFWILYTFQLEKGGVGRHGWCHFVKELKYLLLYLLAYKVQAPGILDCEGAAGLGSGRGSVRSGKELQGGGLVWLWMGFVWPWGDLGLGGTFPDWSVNRTANQQECRWKYSLTLKWRLFTDEHCVEQKIYLKYLRKSQTTTI